MRLKLFSEIPFNPKRRELLVYGGAFAATLFLGTACADQSGGDGATFVEHPSSVAVDNMVTVESPLPSIQLERSQPGSYFVVASTVIGATIGSNNFGSIESALLSVPGALRVATIGGIDTVGAIALPATMATYSAFGGLQAQFEGPIHTLVYDPGTGTMVLRIVDPSRTALNVETQEINLPNEQSSVQDSAQFNSGNPEQNGPQRKSLDTIMKDCGYELKELFSYWLLQNAMGIISADLYRQGATFEEIPNMNLFLRANTAQKEEGRVRNTLIAKNCYDTDNGETVFTVYKSMRDKAFGSNRQGGSTSYVDWVRANINSDTSTLDALNLARAQVTTWIGQ